MSLESYTEQTLCELSKNEGICGNTYTHVPCASHDSLLLIIMPVKYLANRSTCIFSFLLAVFSQSSQSLLSCDRRNKNASNISPHNITA